MKKLTVILALSATLWCFGAPSATTSQSNPDVVPPQVAANVPATSTSQSVTVTNPATLEQGVVAPSGRSIYGSIQSNITNTLKSGTVGTENTANLGMQFNPNFKVGLTQYFNSNIYNPTVPEKTAGLVADDGFINANFDNIWTNPEQGLSLGYEPRLYWPSKSSKGKNGMVTEFRNSLNLAKVLSPVVKLTFTEVVILPVYSQAGRTEYIPTETPGVYTKNVFVNPAFENRVYFTTDVKLSSKLSFSLPLMFHQTRNRDYSAEASRNDSWQFYLYAWPELDYQLTNNLMLGLAYRTGNFLKNNPTSHVVTSDGFVRDGDAATQLILKASL